MKSGIYLITNVITYKVYVGSSKNIIKRKYEHFRLLRNNRHYNPHLQYAYNLYGKQAFHWEILEYCEAKYLVEREDWWIDFFSSRDQNKGYNLAKAARTEISEAQKAKISAAHKGKKMSEESKLKMSLARRQMWEDEEYRERMSTAHKGKTASEETKAKMSASRIGRQPTLGLRHSEESRVNMSNAQRKNWASEGHREKVSTALKGKPWTEARRLAQENRKSNGLRGSCRID